MTITIPFGGGEELAAARTVSQERGGSKGLDPDRAPRPLRRLLILGGRWTSRSTGLKGGRRKEEGRDPPRPRKWPPERPALRKERKERKWLGGARLGNLAGPSEAGAFGKEVRANRAGRRKRFVGRWRNLKLWKSRGAGKKEGGMSGWECGRSGPTPLDALWSFLRRSGKRVNPESPSLCLNRSRPRPPHPLHPRQFQRGKPPRQESHLPPQVRGS